jgi:DUF4097 and DUF4098 domain-containing protein YvlB
MKKVRQVFFAASMAMVVGTASGAVEVGVQRVIHRQVKAIEVDAKCLEIEVVGTQADSLILEGAKIADNVAVKSLKKGATLNVWVEMDGPSLPFDCVGKILLMVPGDVALRLKTTSGEIKASDVRGRGIFAQSATGSIDLERCTSAVVAKSVSGHIEVDSSEGKKSLETVSGRISVDASAGDMYAASVSGTVEFDNIDGSIEAKSVSGSIEIDGQRGAVSLKSVSGALDGNNITARDSCLFETKSGSIDIDFTNPLDEFRFELKSLSGSLSAGEMSGKKSLSVGKGKILVKGESLSGAQDYE